MRQGLGTAVRTPVIPSCKPRLPFAQASVVSLLRDYLILTRPAVIPLLLMTSFVAMALAAGGMPRLRLVSLVMLAGALAAGGASALNQFVERDIDAEMKRTCRRPLAAGRMKPWHALVFGIVLNVAAFAVLNTWVNFSSAALCLGASLFYLFVYTCWLKRTTPQNIVIGGAAGAAPPLVGWAAVSGGLELPAWYLFAIIFLWTPPHFWALAMLIRDDYAKARVPMLPVVCGEAQTARTILIYTVILVGASLLFFTTGAVGWLYLVVALLMGFIYVAKAWRLCREEPRDVAGIYRYSRWYLGAIFLAVFGDSALRNLL